MVVLCLIKPLPPIHQIKRANNLPSPIVEFQSKDRVELITGLDTDIIRLALLQNSQVNPYQQHNLGYFHFSLSYLDPGILPIQEPILATVIVHSSHILAADLPEERKTVRHNYKSSRIPSRQRSPSG
ncbi:hypothetical protein RRG08_030689 [Elysia crispata]|uniref:Uncharacterized protein n=1 Tax=Elysia crispata TaxID=231223 RepID=A0AAE1CSG4_9GAST|nr:hypothetical protein RRG08_030689 [Elysia crispata]